MTGGWGGQRVLFERKPLLTLRELVRARLDGLELRQAARDELRRAKRAAKSKRRELVAEQERLWSTYADPS